MDSNWRSFKQQFELYMAAIGLDDKPDARKIALLLTVAGPQAIEVFNTSEFGEDDDKEKYDTILGKFSAYCSPQKNIVYERYVFRSRMQQPDKTFCLIVLSCDFGDLKDSMIRDQIVYGIQDKRIRERLLKNAKLTLEEAERLCHASELAQQHAKTFNEANAAVVHDSAKVAVVKYKQKSMSLLHIRKTGKMLQLLQAPRTPANVVVADMSQGSALPMAKDVPIAMEKITLQNSVYQRTSPSQ